MLGNICNWFFVLAVVIWGPYLLMFRTYSWFCAQSPGLPRTLHSSENEIWSVIGKKYLSPVLSGPVFWSCSSVTPETWFELLCVPVDHDAGKNIEGSTSWVGVGERTRVGDILTIEEGIVLICH